MLLFNQVFSYVVLGASVVTWLVYLLGLFYRRPSLIRNNVLLPVYAVIPAHNEASIIHSTVRNLYHAGISDVFVIADACTDDTVPVAVSSGAIVFVTDVHNKFKALQFLIKHIRQRVSGGVVLFLDADNHVPDYFLSNLCKYYDYSYIAQLPFKNMYSNSLVSRMYVFMYGLSFQFQRGIMVLRHYGVLAGTGFLVPAKFLDDFISFPVNSLVDDFEATFKLLRRGVPVKFLDFPGGFVINESPISWLVSIHQRVRWSRGFLQVLFSNFWAVLRSPVFFSITFFIALFAFLLPSSFLSLFSFRFYLFSLPVWFLLYLTVIKGFDYMRWYDFFVLPIFFFTSCLASFWALLTFTNRRWYSTPHGTPSVKALTRSDSPFLRG